MVISDAKIISNIGTNTLTVDANDSFEPEVLSYVDNYAFGAPMPGRMFNANSYRYGYQAQEQDPEFWGGAVSYKFRVEDSRVGRFFSTDPLEKKYPHNSPYAFSENRVIDGGELEGLEWVDKTGKEIESDKLKDVKVYIFYDPKPSGEHGGFAEQTMQQYENFEKEYGKGSVALSPAQTEARFKTDWGNMEGTPAIVAINMHGSNQAIHIDPEENRKEYITSTEDGTTNRKGSSATNVSALGLPKADLSKAMLQLNTCHSNDYLQYPLKGSCYTLAEGFNKFYNFNRVRTSGSWGVSFNKDGTARPQIGSAAWNYLFHWEKPHADKTWWESMLDGLPKN